MLWQILVATGEGPGKDIAGGFPMSSLVLIALMIGVFYFIMIRPQQKQRREQQSMIGSLHKGDKVVTIGGIHGRIEGVKDNTVVVKVAENVKVEISKASIASVEKRKDEDAGTLKDS